MWHLKICLFFAMKKKKLTNATMRVLEWIKLENRPLSKNT